MTATSDSDTQRAMGRRLKIVREIRRITQDALAEAIGFSTTAVSAWESGRNRIDVVALGRIMQTLGCTSDYVVAGDRSGLRFELAQLVQAREALVEPPSRRGRPRREAGDGQGISMPTK